VPFSGPKLLQTPQLALIAPSIFFLHVSLLKFTLQRASRALSRIACDYLCFGEVTTWVPMPRGKFF
jgi:hypothetical protein